MWLITDDESWGKIDVAADTFHKCSNINIHINKHCCYSGTGTLRAVLWAVQLVRSHRAPRRTESKPPNLPPPPPPRDAIANGPRGAPLHTSHRAPRQPGTALGTLYCRGRHLSSFTLFQGCPNLFLEGHYPSEFSTIQARFYRGC